jgi:hypothetical protein
MVQDLAVVAARLLQCVSQKGRERKEGGADNAGCRVQGPVAT